MIGLCVMEISKIDLWSTGIYTIFNPQHRKLMRPLKRLLYKIESEAKEKVSSGIAKDVKRGLFESDFDLFENRNNSIKQLKEFCGNAVLTICKHENEEYWRESGNHTLLFNDSWFHITRNGGAHDYHNHANCSWCGIYYVDVGDSTLENGSNSFFDPRVSAHSYADYGTKYINDNPIFKSTPENGKLLIFPSYVYHSAPTYIGTKDRIIISFNTSIHFNM